MKVEPYLFFNGRCDEAIAFYKKVLGAELIMLMRFKESPDPASRPPGSDDKVMHAKFRVGESEIMASDGRCEGRTNFEGFSLSIAVATLEAGQKLFNSLGDGGKVQMPFAKTFFSPGFGMLEDRFGVSWMVVVGP